MSERRRATQLAGRNPSIRLTPLPTGNGNTLEPFPQIRSGHRINVDADILGEKTRKGLQTSAFEIVVNVFRCSNHQGKTCDEAHGRARMAVYESCHVVELGLTKKQHIAAGGDVLLFRQPELYHMTTLVNRHTSAPVRFVAGLSLMIRASEDVYDNLEGRRLEALARLFAQNVRIYVYPMTATDLREWLKSASSTGWEWSETNGWVSASELRCAPPLGHLFAYLLASNFLVPMRVPAGA